MTADDGSNESTDSGIDRRTVLKSAAAVSAAGFVGVPAFSGSAVADLDETLYLTDTQDDLNTDAGDDPFGSPSDDTTKLYEVDLSGGNADLTEKLDFTNRDIDGDGDDDYNHVVAIAASPDGDTIYGIDKFSDRLGTYDVKNDSFTDKGTITNAPGLTLQAATSPDGTLYITGFGNSGFYEVDTSEPSATRVATLTDNNGEELIAGGSDFVFDADGNLFFVDAQSDPRVLYKVSDPKNWNNVTKVNTGDFGPGLTILDKGTGNLVYSDSDDDNLVEINSSGSEVATYPLKEGGSDFDHQFGDLAIAEVADSTTFDLCAGQDTNVGTVTVFDSSSEITITYETTGGWELYETHVDIGDEFSDFPTAGRNDNPKVGQFDLSGTHDGVTSVSYTVGCSDDALSDVGDDFDDGKLFIAAHAVVKPVDGCADFSQFDVNESVEGFGTVNPVINIQSTSSVSGAEAVAQKEGQDDGTYGAPNGSGTTTNGCLSEYNGGFSDVKTKDAQAPHAYEFTVADGVTLSDFSLRMLDYGDLNSDKDEHHYAEMVAYDENGEEVDSMQLEYWTKPVTNPRTAWKTDSRDNVVWDNLYEQGDACKAEEGEPGNWVWEVSGDGIVKVELTFGDGHDPNIAFTDLCYTANDETAWPCEPQKNVEPFNDNGGNWATYIKYGTSLLDC